MLVCVHLVNLLVCVCVCAYLVNFMPAVLVLAADDGVVVQQELAAARVSSHHHAVIQRSQTTAVLVVRGGSQLQQSLRRRRCVWGQLRVTNIQRRFSYKAKPKSSIQIVKFWYNCLLECVQLTLCCSSLAIATICC